MASVLKRFCLSLCAVPLVALADPVTVTTRTTGKLYVDDILIETFGLGGSTAPGEQPFELTLRSTLDRPFTPDRDEWGVDSESNVTVDLRIGDRRYHYEGAAWSGATLYTPYYDGSGDGFAHQVQYDQDLSYYQAGLKNRIVAPTGSLGPGGAFTPRDITWTQPGGEIDIAVYARNPDNPLNLHYTADADTFSVQVTSAVPEPSTFALLAAGLLTLGLRRRYG